MGASALFHPACVGVAVTPTETDAAISEMRTNLAEAHRCMLVARDSQLIDDAMNALHALGAVCAELVDICEELTRPVSLEEFHGLTLGEK